MKLLHINSKKEECERIIAENTIEFLLNKFEYIENILPVEYHDVTLNINPDDVSSDSLSTTIFQLPRIVNILRIIDILIEEFITREFKTSDTDKFLTFTLKVINKLIK